MKIYKQKKAPPYNEKGKTTFNLRNRSGVYMIYKGSELRYVGFSGSDVYKALYRHFQSWTDKRQQRVTYERLKSIKVRLIYTNNAANANRLEKALIIKYKPTDNPQRYWETNTTDQAEEAMHTEFIDNPAQPIITGRAGDDLPF